jgi:hypothetical protein
MALCKVGFDMEQYGPTTFNGRLLYQILTKSIKGFMLKAGIKKRPFMVLIG